jgi:sugar phosphate isomerase/epimerase
MAFDEDDLTMCLAGLRDDPFSCNAADFEHMLAATAAEGFRGVSLWALHARLVSEDGLSTKDIARRCDAHGLQVRVVEIDRVGGWPRADRAGIDAEVRPVFELAARLGAEEVLVFTIDEEPVDLEIAARGFSYLCDLAAPHGLRVGLEFLPWTGIPDLRTAWAIVRRAGRENGGLVLDTWHFQRQHGGMDLDTLRAIPSERIHVLQLNDALAAPAGSVTDETMNRRLLPGEGAIDIAGLLDTLQAMGAEPMLAPEVFNHDLAALGPDEAARQVAAATRRVLAAAESER